MTESVTLPAPPEAPEVPSAEELDAAFRTLLDRVYATNLPKELVPRRDVVLVEDGRVAFARRDVFLQRFKKPLEVSGWYESISQILEIIKDAAELKAGLMPAMVVVGREIRLAWLVVARANTAAEVPS